MKKSLYILFALLITFGCATKDTGNNDLRTIRTNAVAVKVDSNFTIISDGRLDNWYRIDTRLTEGMIYEVTLEIPRVIREPLIVPANLIALNPVDFMQRDQYLRYITKYQELKSAEKEDTAIGSSSQQ